MVIYNKKYSYIIQQNIQNLKFLLRMNDHLNMCEKEIHNNTADMIDINGN